MCKENSAVILIMFCFDNNYALPAATAFVSLLENADKNYFYKLYVGGQRAYTLNNKFLDKIVDYFFEYPSFIKGEIKKNNLEKYIEFTEPLSALQMKERYLKSNVFIFSSTIENNPNSVGEAMILGVPIVASNVGVTSSILSDEKDGLL